MLSLRSLTMRFGGLTAVNKFDFEVDKGRICSIIGPNGAGKTTVFNAVTGVYAPTEGNVLFEGRRLTRPFTWHVGLACTLVGVATAVSLALISANIDLLWRAAVKRPAMHPEQPFSYGRCLREGWRYLRGDLALEPVRRGSGGGSGPRVGWAIVPPEGGSPLFTADTEEEAADKIDDVELAIQIARGDDPERAIQPWNGEYRIVPERDGLHALNTFKSREAAAAWLNKLAAVDRERRGRRTRVWLGGLAGLSLGGFGAWSIWNRSRRTPDVISRGGIARTFQNIRLFQNMTVVENVLVGMDRRFSSGVLRMMLRTPAMRKAEAAGVNQALELLKFVGLERKWNLLAKNLPYGDQRRLEIARALATEPRMLLLDEPAAGMNPAESHDLMKLIRQIRDRGITVLLIEHHMKLVMDISDRIAVLDYGVKIAEGTPQEVRANPKVIEAYLGKEEVS